MAANQITFLKGEKKPIYGQVADSLGAVTIGAATFTLYDSAGNVVLNAVNVTGKDAAGSLVRAWYLLDTTALNAGYYYGMFKMPNTNTGDAMARTSETDWDIYVMPMPEVQGLVAQPG